MTNNKTLGIAVVAAAFLLVTQAASAARVYTDQSVYQVNVGDTFYIDVLVDTEGVGVNTFFNTISILDTTAPLSTVRLTDAAVPDLIWPVSDFSIDEDTGGSANIAGISRLDDDPNGPDVLLYTWELSAEREGIALLLQGTAGGWFDGDGNAIDVRFDNPLISVVPVPAAVWLLGSGLVAFGAIARRRRMAA